MNLSGQIQLFPLLRIAVSLIGGIVLGELLFGVVVWHQWFWLFTSMTLVSFLLHKFPVVQGAAIMLATCCLGAMLLSKAEESIALPEDEMVYEAVLTSEPVERGRVVRCDMTLTTGPLAGRHVKASILRDNVNCLYKRLHVGDGILALSTFEAPKRFGQSNFHYDTYLRSHGFVATTFIFWSNWRKASVDLSHLSRLERMKIRAMKFRQHLLERYREEGLDEQSFAVVAAMTLGDKSMIDEQTREAYSVSGASHVLALSGLHLGIIYMLLSYLTLGRRRRFFREMITLASIWSYVMMVGMAPSVVRAALMISVYAFVGLLQRDKMSLNTLALTAIIMLLANPLNLFDIGFQMSFMSVLAIMILYRPIYHLIHPNYLFAHRVLSWIWSMVAVSVSAQVGGAPLVAYYFGRFSGLFLLSSFIVIPSATAILYLAAMFFLLGFLPMAQRVVASVMSLLVKFLNDALQKISSIPGASMEDVSINRAQLFVLYLLIALFVGAFLRYSNSLAKKRGV